MRAHVGALRSTWPDGRGRGDRGAGSVQYHLLLPGLWAPLPACPAPQPGLSVPVTYEVHHRTEDENLTGWGGAAGAQRWARVACSFTRRSISQLGLNCESSCIHYVQRTQNIFPFSFCQLNLLWLQKEAPPRAFSRLGSLRDSARRCQRQQKGAWPRPGSRPRHGPTVLRGG